mmetsp:Transcript_16096/g.32931  ORF Transcript_16096/g.32931 Transcript_16096/m.32931 type:complete len:192 (+) Transcript_16096:49-624(+)
MAEKAEEPLDSKRRAEDIETSSNDEEEESGGLDYEDSYDHASAILALKTGSSISEVTQNSFERKEERERNRLHAKNTRERKKLKLAKLQQRAKSLGIEIEELESRSQLMAGPSVEAGDGGPPLTVAMRELQSRAGKLSMRVQAQDVIMMQLRRENQALMLQIESSSSLPPPPAPLPGAFRPSGNASATMKI